MLAGVCWPIKDGLFSRQVVPCTMEKSTKRCVRTPLMWTHGFTWTSCMGLGYFKLFYIEISIHGPALYLNLLHTDPHYTQISYTWIPGSGLHYCRPVDSRGPRAWVQVISGLFPGFYPWKLKANPHKPTTVNLFIPRVFEFPEHGVPGINIILWIGL